MTSLQSSEERLFDRAAQIIEAARGQVARTVNTAMVHAYWFIGREIVEQDQGGEARAGYGEQLTKRLAKRLTAKFGRGFGHSNIKRMRQFYLAFSRGSALNEPESIQKGAAPRRQSAELATPSPTTPLFPPQLSWTHYRLLMTVSDETARHFYEIEAAQECWSSRELERQIGSLLFERLARSRDKEAVLELGRVGQQIAVPEDVIKDPLVLEFLELQERPHWLEADLEQAIMGRLQGFLLELGRGFCFVARQKRITLEGDHFYVDLVFYNRLLRCFVLIDLKLGKLTHQDLGQMQMYVRWFDQYQRVEGEASTVGVVLCSQKNDAMVRITIPEGVNVQANRYQIYLPTEEQLRQELVNERERIERALRLSSPLAPTEE